MLCRCYFLSPDAASRQPILGITHYLHGSASRGDAVCEGRRLRLLSGVCLSASLFFFPSSQEAGPAPEGTLEEVGAAEMAAMRKQVRWG